MGSPLSPVVANLCIEHLEEITLQTVHLTPDFGSDTWTTLLLSGHMDRRSWNASMNISMCNTTTSGTPLSTSCQQCGIPSSIHPNHHRYTQVIVIIILLLCISIMNIIIIHDLSPRTWHSHLYDHKLLYISHLSLYTSVLWPTKALEVEMSHDYLSLAMWMLNNVCAQS